MKRTVEDIIEIGKELTAVKDRLEHGQFLPWIKAEFEMSKSAAYRMMDVAERFGNFPKLGNFKPAILYALAAPGTPDAVVEHALEKAEAGDKVTLAEIQDWKAKAADLELALKAQAETIDFFKQQAYSTGDELAAAGTPGEFSRWNPCYPETIAATPELPKGWVIARSLRL